MKRLSLTITTRLSLPLSKTSGGFKIIGDIDFTFDGFEFAFEADKFESTLEVKRYFEKKDFLVELVCFRDYTYSQSVHPLLKNTKLYKDGKKIFEVRVLADSPFFEQVHAYSNQHTYAENENTRKGFIKMNSLVLMLLALFSCTAIILFLCSTPTNGDESIKRSELNLDEKILPEYGFYIANERFYDLVFETSEGIKEFQNADYDLEWNRNDDYLYCVTTYDSDGKPCEWNYFPSDIVKSISKKAKR